MRVAFAGTPAFAARALEALLEAGFTVPLVLTQPDRPAGRGLKLQPSAVKQVALRSGLPIIQPRGLRLDGRWADDAQAAEQALRQAQADALVVAAYGLILPAWVLALPRWGCLNIHASVLPRWRGAAPIHRAIEAGDRVTGVTIMQMDEGLDTGDMLLVETHAIAPAATTASLHDELADVGARLIVQALRQVGQGDLPRRAQPADGITYAHKVDKSEAPLDWSAPADVLERRIRAFDPFPGASLRDGDAVIKVWGAAISPVVAADAWGGPGAGPVAGGHAPGTILAIGVPSTRAMATGAPLEAVRVACGQGALDLTVLQRPSANRQPAVQVARAQQWAVGHRLTTS